jgi:hypothetical protein
MSVPLYFVFYVFAVPMSMFLKRDVASSPMMQEEKNYLVFLAKIISSMSVSIVPSAHIST